MKSILLSLFVLTSFLSCSQGYFEVANLTAFDMRNSDLFGGSVDHSATDVIFGALYQDKDENGLNIINGAGAAYIFSITGSMQKIVASDRTSSALFGSSVVIEGNYAVVTTNKKKVYVFKKNASDIWEEQQILHSPELPILSSFGNSVAISNETIIIGDFSNDLDEYGLNHIENAGSVFVYELNSSDEWIFTQKIVPTIRFMDTRFGSSIAINGQNIVVGAENDNYDANDLNPLIASGSCYIFNKSASTFWQQKQKIVSSDRVEMQFFGDDVGIDGTNIIVGATGEDRDSEGLNPINRAGAAYVISYDSSTDEWNETQKITAQDRAVYALFGNSVDINSDKILISTYMPTSLGVELHLDNGLDEWELHQVLISSDHQNGDWFGFDVSINDSFIMIGAKGNSGIDGNGNIVPSAGSGYVFYNMPCSLPTITNVDIDVDCSSSSVNINIDGNLNSPSNSWAVYTADCGETLIATSVSNNFTVSLPPGTTAIFIRGEDGPGCVNEDIGICFNISIGPLVDAAPPIAICQDITVYLDNLGTTSILAEDIDGGSYDDCGNVNMAAAPLTFDCDDIGDNTSTLQIWDDSGNGGFCNATVTVEDTMNLVVACQDITISLDASGNASITEADIDGGTYDNCNEVFLAAAPNFFDTSNIGDNTVWLQVWTNFGEFGYCAANVQVVNYSPLISNESIDISRMTQQKSIDNISKIESSKIAEDNLEITVFPNPVLSEFTIKSNEEYLIHKVKIMNSSFVEVQSYDYEIQSENIILSAEGLSQGLYFIVIYSGDKTSVQKLIKI